MKLPKPLRDFAQKHNFTWDAKANLLYGSWQGYYFTIAQNPSGRPTHIITPVSYTHLPAPFFLQNIYFSQWWPQPP